MKTFQQFLEESYLILEKRNNYDDSFGFDRRVSPDEKAHVEVHYDGPREKKEIEKHYASLGQEVPYEPGFTRIRHNPSGITYEIKHHRPETQNPRAKQKPENFLSGMNIQLHGHKPSHEIQWYPDEMDTSHLSLAKRIRIARNAQEVWDKHIRHRLPSGHLLTNIPDSKSLERKYEGKRGFGNTTPTSNKQYSAVIGKKLVPVKR